jgi:hypothetical protein
MTQTITIDGRGNTIPQAIKEMRERMAPLEQEGFNPISEVEIVDAQSKEILESYALEDPEFQLHLKSDEQEKPEQKIEPPHAPERKGHFKYIARIKLAS